MGAGGTCHPLINPRPLGSFSKRRPVISIETCRFHHCCSFCDRDRPPFLCAVAKCHRTVLFQAPYAGFLVKVPPPWTTPPPRNQQLSRIILHIRGPRSLVLAPLLFWHTVQHRVWAGGDNNLSLGQWANSSMSSAVRSLLWAICSVVSTGSWPEHTHTHTQTPRDVGWAYLLCPNLPIKIFLCLQGCTQVLHTTLGFAQNSMTGGLHIILGYRDTGRASGKSSTNHTIRLCLSALLRAWICRPGSLDAAAPTNYWLLLQTFL